MQTLPWPSDWMRATLGLCVLKALDGGATYGYAIAADTGSFIRDGRTVADLYMGSYQECCWFGARNLNVYVIG